MNPAFGRGRRFLLALFCIAVAACIFRPQIADGLVGRGDDLMYRNRAREALARYARALAIDPESSDAADRYVFVSMEQHRSDALQSAMSEASRYLERKPNDPAVLEDRALCYLRLRQYERAMQDFERAAFLARDPREFLFAALSARRAGDRKNSRRLLLQAMLTKEKK
jgi:tetratricopeptide (TPR) repeat protein